MAFFLLERFELDYAGGVTVGVFSVTWIGLIQLTNMEMKNISRSLSNSKGSNNGLKSSQVKSKTKGGGSSKSTPMPLSSREKFAIRLKRYAKINTFFGSLLCVFQVLSYNINTWFTDDLSAAGMNLGFDISCIGVAYG